MPAILVKDVETGEQIAVDDSIYRANPSAYEPVEGQEIAVDITGGLPADGVDRALSVEDYQRTGDAFEALTADELADATRERIADERFGGIVGTVKQGFRGAASGLTLGGSELLLRAGETGLEREELEAARAASGPAFTVGEVGGAVLGAAFSGGTGLAGRAIASTPAGMIARAGSSIAARGAERTALQRLGWQAAGGAFEAAVQSAATGIAEQVLSDKPFSAEVLGARILTGTLLGGGASAGVGALGAGGRKLAAALEREAGAPTGAIAKALREVGESGESVAAKEGDRIAWRKLFAASDTEPGKIASAYGDTISAVERSAIVRKEAQAATRELFSDARLMAVSREVAEPLKIQTEGALQAFRSASNDAQRWASDIVEASGGAGKLAKGGIPTISADDADRAVEVLSRLDEAKIDLDDVLSRARKALAPETVPPPRALDAVSLGDAPAPPSSGIRGMVERARQSRTGNVIADVASGAELIGSVGGPQILPSVQSIPVIGEVASLYLKARALRNAFGRAGSVVSSPAVRAAGHTAALQDRMSAAVAAVGRAASGSVARSLAAKGGALSAERAAELIGFTDRLSEIGPGGTSPDERVELDGLPADVADQAIATMERAREYLAGVAPRDPLKGTAFASRSPRINPMDLAVYDQQVKAALDPAAAVEDVLGDATMYPSAMVEALRAVHPQIYAATQAELLGNLDRLVEDLPDGTRNRIGQLWGIPMTIAQLPSYPSAAAGAQPSPGGSAQRPPPPARMPAPSRSMMASLDEPESTKRAER